LAGAGVVYMASDSKLQKAFGPFTTTPLDEAVHETVTSVSEPGLILLPALLRFWRHERQHVGCADARNGVETRESADDGMPGCILGIPRRR
jgi:hypothetical protein